MDNIIYFIKSILSSDMASGGFPLIYKGEMSHSNMRSFAFMANRKMAENNIQNPVRKRIFHIMIECLQNITNHSDDYDKGEKQIGNGLFVVGYNKDSFYVMTGNLVRNNKIKPLEERIVALNSASPQELKEIFLKQMMQGNINEKGGAGLGLMDIARKSGRKLFYHFAPYDKNRHFFLFVVTIPLKLPLADEEEQ